MDGTEQEMMAAAKRFGNRLNGRFNIPVEWQDERLTTYEALDQMGIRSKMDSRQRSDVDQLSAQLILQSWLNQQ
jgi:putative Holliday junction resolvase